MRIAIRRIRRSSPGLDFKKRNGCTRRLFCLRWLIHSGKFERASPTALQLPGNSAMFSALMSIRFAHIHPGGRA
jgi:hypothetical protein